jgi:cytochrome c553
MVKCHICSNKNNLESHHIIPQKDFDEDTTNKNKLHIKKDNYSNIVTLCSSCHDKIDTNELVINGWIETTNGKTLDYFIQEKKSKNKYEPEMIEFIKKLKNKFTPQMALIKIKEKYDQKISKKTLDKYWS